MSLINLMKLHEYQAKKILKNHGVNVARGVLVTDPSQVPSLCQDIAKSVLVVKAQIHAGGRGKGTLYDGPDPKTAKETSKGGVKIAKNIDEAQKFAKEILGSYLHTIQTASSAKLVSQVYIEEGTKIEKEFYLSILLDRSIQKPIFVVSREGGVDIEEVASRSPEKILRFPIETALGLQPWQIREILFSLNVPKEEMKQGGKFLQALWQTFIKEDASMLEINPLVLTEERELIALDAKLELDDNALFRHPSSQELRDKSEENPLEVKALEYNLNYIRLEGNVGCMVNGAGLAMATMDIVKLAGAEPANFLDVGGGANVDTVANGFRIILDDPNVKAIFVNIFGGIVQCDRVANGIVEATKRVSINIPLLVRLQGTNASKAREILANSGISLLVAETLEEGARKITEAIR